MLGVVVEALLIPLMQMMEEARNPEVFVSAMLPGWVTETLWLCRKWVRRSERLSQIVARAVSQRS